MSSKVAFIPGDPSIGRIRGDSVTPPHTLASIKRRISRVEETPALANADFFAGDDPLKDGYISILGTDGPGLSKDEPMAIVQTPIVQTPVVQMPIVQVTVPIVQVESPIPDGRYGIKNRTVDLFWDCKRTSPMEVVHFYFRPVRGVETMKRDDTEHVRSIFQLFKCSKDNSFFRSGTSHMILMVTSL